jgi:hypothetical protein
MCEEAGTTLVVFEVVWVEEMQVLLRLQVVVGNPDHASLMLTLISLNETGSEHVLRNRRTNTLSVSLRTQMGKVPYNRDFLAIGGFKRTCSLDCVYFGVSFT